MTNNSFCSHITGLLAAGTTISLVLVHAEVGKQVTAKQPPVTPPSLMVEAPENLSGVATAIRKLDRNRLLGAMTLMGLNDAGPPIRIVLASNSSPLGLDTPAWIAGFANPEKDNVVLFPERIGSYPFRSLEGVLYHEIAHILIFRASNGSRVPRWFNEGLAKAAERSWSLEDQSRLAWELVISSHVTVTELEGLFNQGKDEISRAYVLSDALVRDILSNHGAQTAANILARMKKGIPFDLALFQETGTSARKLTLSFWSRNAIWERWISFIGHPYTLWSFVTLLALVAIWKHRRQRRIRRTRWELEELAEDQAWEEYRSKSRLH